MFGKSFYYTISCLIAYFPSFGQQPEHSKTEKEFHVHKRILSCRIDDNIRESSGLVYFDHGLWTLNDGGNPAELYEIDSISGKILKSVFVKNATNNDWEALAQDDSYLYIGDFGNNFGNRKNLQILKIVKKDLVKDTVIAEHIKFAYEAQSNFQLTMNSHNFDCEAFCAIGDSLFLFSKNWANLKTYVYVLPKSPGNFMVNIVDSFDTRGLITDADYNMENKTLVLLGYDIKKFSMHSFLWIFRDFKETKFFSGKKQRVKLHLFLKQTEAVAHQGNLHYYFTNERIQRSFVVIRQKLYRLKLKYKKEISVREN